MSFCLLVVWAAARLAPIQICTWGHPSTTGLHNIDYYISSDSYHTNNLIKKRYEAQDRFTEQLIRLNSLGAYFIRPNLSMTTNISINSLIIRSKDYYSELFKLTNTIELQNLITQKQTTNNNQIKYLLCMQHLSKFHPNFDDILFGLLITIPNSYIIIINNNNKYFQWKLTLLKRWKLRYFNLINRIIWLPALSYEEYLVLLAIGDVMLDTLPFGGGVTIFESLAVCTPVVTLPSLQTVPTLAKGIIQTMNVSKSIELLMITTTIEKYVQNVQLILNNNDNLFNFFPLHFIFMKIISIHVYFDNHNFQVH